MAQTQQNRLPPVPIPSFCSCSSPSPTYSPKMESLSDADLKVLEMLGFAGYTGPSPVELTCESIKNYILNPGECWQCLSSRKRQELVVSAFGNPGPANIALVRQALQLIQQCLTPDQLSSLLDYYKYTYILACGTP